MIELKIIFNSIKLDNKHNNTEIQSLTFLG
jgi:hypothetical protein